MQLKWLAPHRRLVEALYQWGNSYSVRRKKPFQITPEVALCPAEIQVLEYILENEEQKQNMAAVAHRLGISASSLTILAARLEKQGFLQKYYQDGNHKDVIVLVTDLGREIYRQYSNQLFELWNEPVLRPLDGIPPEYLERFILVLHNMTFAPERPSPGQPLLTPAVKKKKTPSE